MFNAFGRNNNKVCLSFKGSVDEWGLKTLLSLGPVHSLIVSDDDEFQELYLFNVFTRENTANLETIEVHDGCFSDITVFENCTNLKTLVIALENDVDLSALSKYTKLTDFVPHHVTAKSISTLRSASLETLDLMFFQICSEYALGNTLGNNCPNLREIVLHGANIEDLSGLSTCQELRTLDLSETKVADISVLKNCRKLQTLDLSESKVADISVLKNCPKLQTLDLSDTDVADISVLKKCRELRTLNLSNTLVDDISALKNCRELRTLNLSDTDVDDISALKKCRELRTLW